MNMSELTTFEDLPDILRAAVSKRTLIRMSARGSFPPYLKLSAHGPALWRRADVDRHLANKLAALEVTP